MSPIDADFAKERIKKSGLTNREKIAFLLLLEDVPMLAPPPNDPLTLEELREMDEEPVWCERQKNYVFIACVKDEPYKQIWFFTKKGKWDTILFHHTRFYRRKPEEGTA